MQFSDAEKVNILLNNHQSSFSKVVDYDVEKDKILYLDFTLENKELLPEQIADTNLFTQYITNKLAAANAKYGIGGYFEHRILYERSNLFDTNDEPRRLHLGIDIWAEAGTNIYSFMDSRVHSFAFNDNFGDYGVTIVLEHQINDITFYSLYGHLSLQNIERLKVGEIISKGSLFANFGAKEENGNWPPHLHFQLITNMEGYVGDYPGVAKFSEKAIWQAKIPDPAIILKM